MTDQHWQVLASALDKRRRDDTPETAVGREARRAGMNYQDYLDIMQAVRDRARRDRCDPWQAARALVDEQKEDQGQGDNGKY